MISKGILRDMIKGMIRKCMNKGMIEGLYHKHA
jgi:hypothetical protein